MIGKHFARASRNTAPRLFQPRNVQRVVQPRSITQAAQPECEHSNYQPEMIEFDINFQKQQETEFTPELTEVPPSWQSPSSDVPPYDPVKVEASYGVSNTAENLPYVVIEPIWQVHEFPVNPKLYEIDCSSIDMHMANPDLEEQIRDTFDEVGAVHLINTGMTEHQAMRRWASVIIENQIKYAGGANPRKAIEPNVYDVGAPVNAWLHYHHEMAYVSKSPRFISLWCKYTLPDRGWTYLSDNIIATDKLLSTEFGQKLKDLNICYVRNLTDKEFYSNKDQSIIYNHWQDSFMTDNPAEVEPIAAERGLKVEWETIGKNRYCRTKYYVSAFEYFAGLDRNLLYSSVADDFMWFDSWPGISHIPPNERPLALTFGDDTPMTQEEKQQYVDIYDEGGFPLKWKPGDVGIICNYRFAHGRPAFTLQPGEKRELGVLLGETFDRIGHIEGKW